jgi:hypothetical protein
VKTISCARLTPSPVSFDGDPDWNKVKIGAKGYLRAPKGKNMKNKLLLFFITIALCMAIHLKMNFASEKPSWYDYLRSKWTQFTSSRIGQLTQEKAPLVAATGLSAKLGSYAGVIPTGYIKWLGISFPVTLVIVALVYNIDSIISYYRTGSFNRTDAIIKIKDNLAQVLSNNTLYPTRSSKIHALLKKDEFTQYITDEYGLVQEACNELIGEINKIEYTEAQKKADGIIDQQMSKISNMLKQYVTLEEQIKVLESEEYSTNILGMQAYLSVYFRLKNKQNVESKLSQEEKASRQAERLEESKFQKARQEYNRIHVSEPSVD